MSVPVSRVLCLEARTLRRPHVVSLSQCSAACGEIVDRVAYRSRESLVESTKNLHVNQSISYLTLCS